MTGKDFFKINNEKGISLKKGIFLVSPPLMADGIFHKSVILLLEYNEEGSLGLILNKLSNVNISDVLKELPDFHKPAFLGGPVATNHLQTLHKHPFVPDAVNIIDNIFWGGDFKKTFEMINLNHIDKNDINFYLGYSGWAQGQLEKELKQNLWILVSVERYNIWKIPADLLWETIVTDLGLNPKVAANIPDNPIYN